jgi:hypothetical protein
MLYCCSNKLISTLACHDVNLQALKFAIYKIRHVVVSFPCHAGPCHYGMIRPQVVDRGGGLPDMEENYEYIEQSRTADKGWSSTFAVGGEQTPSTA